ncbi:MAG TPA: TonB-dependent receptor plug domain-containing protein [Lacunisphaera sp.]|nr:TonB-dependent receptor plug domain-containing protein [Lacunisphaera sp.]
MNKPDPSPVGRSRSKRIRTCSFLLAGLIAGSVCAQQVTPAKEPPATPPAKSPPVETAGAANDDTVVLSPFQVNAEEDTGYSASTAQSGTRLRTELKDIASSISVVTKDFMNDIGATDLGGLLVYTLGTEVNGVGGNFSDAGTVANPNGNEADYDGAFASAAPSTRVRGLTSADLSRDFFITNIPLDSYNTERVEISRGPNAMLFGLGSPSGIINNSLSVAKLNARKTQVELRTDQYGSFRGVLDHNEVLVKNKLGFRVASVYEDNHYKVEEAWRRNKRLYLTGTWRPFPNTTIRGSMENGELDGNSPETRPPYDAYTFWWDAGRPVWDPNTNTGSMLGTANTAAGYPAALFNANGSPAAIGAPPGNTGRIFSAQIGAMGGGNRNMTLVYSDPNSSVPNLGLPGSDVMGIRTGNYPGHNISSTGAQQQTEQRGLRDSAYILNNALHWDDITFGFWKSTQLTDPAIFDFYHHMLHGPNKYEWARFHTYNAALEQRLFDGNGGLELAVNRDVLKNGSTLDLDSIISGYALRIDMQTMLPNGMANPNFGRPFTVAYSKAGLRRYVRDTGRITGFYNLDLRKVGDRPWLGRLLGQHRFTGTYTNYENTAFLSDGNFAMVPGTDFSLAQWGLVDNNGAGRRGLPIIHYLGPNVSQSATPALGAVSVPTNQWPSDLDSAKILFYNAPASGAKTPGTWSERTFGIANNGEHDVDATRRYVTYTREKVKSLVGIAQSYWLDRKLVSTLGWRQDDVQTYNAGSPTINPDTGLAETTPDYLPLPVLHEKVTSFNYGIVAHSPNFLENRLPFGTELSVSYNEADNFKPAGQRYNLWNEPISSETGHTQEYGAMVNTFHGKLVLRYGHYRTTSGLSSTLVSGLNTPKGQLISLMKNTRRENLEHTNDANPAGIAAWNAWYDGPVGSQLRETFRFTESTSINPTTGETVAVLNSDSRNAEVFETADVVSTGDEFEVALNPTKQWRIAFNANRARAVRSNVALNLRAVFEDLRTVADGPAGSLLVADTGATTVAQTWRTIYNQLLPYLATENAPADELREWRWNAITNYTFSKDSRLNGFNVGGGVRWQDKLVYGFPIVDDPTFGIVPDIHHPYYAPTQTNYDAWIGYRRKFEKFDWQVQLNVRNIGVGNELIPVSAQPDGSVNAWRIRESQTWSLRNTFTF